MALRAAPTLRHFDPEALTYWRTAEGRGRVARLDRETPVPLEAAVSWGSVRVIDRLGIDNRFLTFGGVLRAAALDTATTVAALRSPAPIPRWSGHSQGLDPLASEVGAFFGRLMVPVDFEPGAEARIAGADPATLYAGFIRDGHDRLAHAEPLRTAESSFADWVAAEAGRLQAQAPDAWASAARLIAELGLGG